MLGFCRNHGDHAAPILFVTVPAFPPSTSLVAASPAAMRAKDFGDHSLFALFPAAFFALSLLCRFYPFPLERAMFGARDQHRIELSVARAHASPR